MRGTKVSQSEEKGNRLKKNYSHWLRVELVRKTNEKKSVWRQRKLRCKTRQSRLATPGTSVRNKWGCQTENRNHRQEYKRNPVICWPKNVSGEKRITFRKTAGQKTEGTSFEKEKTSHRNILCGRETFQKKTALNSPNRTFDLFWRAPINLARFICLLRTGMYCNVYWWYVC